MMIPSAFELAATIIFGLAIVHTFLSPFVYDFSHYLKMKKQKDEKRWKAYHFSSEVLYLLSEVEVIFGIWLIPLFIWYTAHLGWPALIDYLNARSFNDAIYMMVIVVVIGSRPIFMFIERVLEWIAKLGKDTPAAWWWTILTIGPLLGSLIKESGAMAISSLLLVVKFYNYKPSKAFQYATFGLLFANVSVGGMLASFSSRALFFVAKDWGWTSSDMFRMFGWKAIMGILIANFVYYMIFRKEFAKTFPKKLPFAKQGNVAQPTPLWITIIHIIFCVGIVLASDSAPIFVGIFLLFLGFYRATSFYQGDLHLKGAILVAFFFASLIIHGELQGWWIIPMIQNTSYFASQGLSYILSIFVDNATVGYVVVGIPNLDSLNRYLVIAGAMAAGGLSVVANAPNPIGISILRDSFQGRISFMNIFLGALFPSLLFFFIFWIFR